MSIFHGTNGIENICIQYGKQQAMNGGRGEITHPHCHPQFSSLMMFWYNFNKSRDCFAFFEINFKMFLFYVCSDYCDYSKYVNPSLWVRVRVSSRNITGNYIKYSTIGHVMSHVNQFQPEFATLMRDRKHFQRGMVWFQQGNNWEGSIRLKVI